MQEKLIFALKKVVNFVAFFAVIYLLWKLGMYLFPGTIGQGTEEAGSDIQGFWVTVYESVIGSLKEAVKQIFMNIHQTIVLLFVGWLFTGIRSLWGQLKGKVNSFLDIVLVKLSNEQREKVKAHLDAIIIANIELVESAFAVIGGGENEDIEAKRKRNEEKLSAALTMILYDLMKDDAGRQMANNYTKEELVRMLICEIEKTLYKQKVASDMQATGMAWETKVDLNTMAKVSPLMVAISDSESVKMNKASAGRLRNIMKLAQETLPLPYLQAMQTELEKHND